MAIFDMSEENEEQLIFKRKRVSSKEAASSRVRSWIVSDDDEDDEGVFEAEVQNHTTIFLSEDEDEGVSNCLICPVTPLFQVSDANDLNENMEEEEEGEDRMSALPYCLILEILSRLPETKEAIITSSLSKRWQYVWTSVPNLIFIHDAPYGELYAPLLPYFITTVDHTLAQCRQVNLNRFVLNTRYETKFETQLKNWICHVINRNVQDLQILLDKYSPGAFDFCDLESFFINSCFTNLKLACCVFHPTGAISWNNLTSLSITCGELDEVLLHNILSGSPRLETFELDACYGYTRLDVYSKSVKKLVFVDPNVLDCIIDAPYITTLTLKNISVIRNKIVLLNVPSLIIAEIDYLYDVHYDMFYDEEEETLKEHLLKLRHVKELKYGISCVPVVSRLQAKGFTCPPNLKYADFGPPVY